MISTGQTSLLTSTPDSIIVTVTSFTTVPNDGEPITIPSSIMGSNFHSDNHQTESTNSNVPNTQFNTIKNTIKTTDRTIVSDKTNNTAQLVPSKTESITTTASRGPTIQSSTGDSNTTTLIAAVISTVLILLVVSILVIIIVSVLMYKRRKRLAKNKMSTGQDDFCIPNPVYSETTSGGGAKQGTTCMYYTLDYYILLHCF